MRYGQSVLFRCSRKSALEDMDTVMHLPTLPIDLHTHTPGCVWFREVVLRLPLQNFMHSGFRPLVPIEANLRKVIHLRFPPPS